MDNREDITKSFVCDTCGRSFKTKSSLTVHNTVHSGERPYKCDICEKSFSHKSHFTRHMLVRKTFNVMFVIQGLLVKVI